MIRSIALGFAGFLIAWLSVCAASRKVAFNTDDCVSAINLARTALLKVPVPAVTATSVKEYYLQSLLEWRRKLYEPSDDADCTIIQGVSPAAIGCLILKTGGLKQPDAKTIARLIQKEVDDGLNIIGNNYQEKWSSASKIYDRWASQNLALLMHSKATRVMCAAPSNCVKGQSVVLCVFDEEPATGEAPFSQGLLSALQARKAANVDIANLYEQQMKTPGIAEDGTRTSSPPTNSLFPDGTKTSTPATNSPIPGAARAVPCTLAVFLSMFALLLAH